VQAFPVGDYANGHSGDVVECRELGADAVDDG
jgi:hypothetical protein